MLTWCKTCKLHATRGTAKACHLSRTKYSCVMTIGYQTVMQLASIVIILSWQFLQLTAADAELPQRLLQLLNRIQLEQHYDTIVVYGREPCVFHTVLQALELPMVILAKGSSEKDWNFGSDPLLLCCGATAEQEENSRTLLKLQRARRLVYLDSNVHPASLCEDYIQREQHNVAMLSAEGNFYSCRFFQEENHVQLQLEDSIYVEQFRNMKGAIISSEVDQLAPRSILYRDEETNKIRMLGFVANLINMFVERVNATLRLRDDYEFGKVTFYGDIERLIEANQLDVATTLGATMLVDSMDRLSYPYVVTTYCFMVPLPAPLPYQQIYTIIVDPLVLGLLLMFFLIFSLLLIYSRDLSWRGLSLSNLLLNDRCLRGLLGQSFPWPVNPSRHLKAICCLICFASVMTTTMYNAYLQAYFTHPPPEDPLRSFEDVRESPYKIAMHRQEANMLLKIYNLTLADAKNVYLIDEYNDFIHLRDTFNASFIYPVTEIRWKTYEEQQDLFEVPVFYYSDDICLFRIVYMCIPIRRHLPYRHLFEEHMQHMQEFGLVQLWLGRSFYDMVILKQTAIHDYSTPKPVEDALFLRDLTFIFALYLIGHLAACFSFLIELCRRRSPKMT